MTREIKKEVQVKQGRNWVAGYTSLNAADVYSDLSHDLIAKKLNSCTYIKSIKRTNNYDGTQTITVNYDNETRSIYTITC